MRTRDSLWLCLTLLLAGLTACGGGPTTGPVEKQLCPALTLTLLNDAELASPLAGTNVPFLAKASGGCTTDYTYAFVLDGVRIAAQSSGSYAWNSLTATNGRHTLSIRATEGANTSPEVTRTITVQNGTAGLVDTSSIRAVTSASGVSVRWGASSWTPSPSAIGVNLQPAPLVNGVPTVIFVGQADGYVAADISVPASYTGPEGASVTFSTGLDFTGSGWDRQNVTFYFQRVDAGASSPLTAVSTWSVIQRDGYATAAVGSASSAGYSLHIIAVFRWHRCGDAGGSSATLKAPRLVFAYKTSPTATFAPGDISLASTCP